MDNSSTEYFPKTGLRERVRTRILLTRIGIQHATRVARVAIPAIKHGLDVELMYGADPYPDAIVRATVRGLIETSQDVRLGRAVRIAALTTAVKMWLDAELELDYFRAYPREELSHAIDNIFNDVMATPLGTRLNHYARGGPLM